MANSACTLGRVFVRPLVTLKRGCGELALQISNFGALSPPKAAASTSQHLSRVEAQSKHQIHPQHRFRLDNQLKLTMASTYKLPEGFLEGPAPNLKRSNVNFEKGGLIEEKDAWAVVLDGVMTQEECDQLIAAAEATTGGKWERALVNIGGGRQAMYEDTRKCGRIIWDDREIMAKLWARIEASVSEIHRLQNWPGVTGFGPVRRKETWKVTRLNERQRFLKYTGGEYFKAHCDGTYETPDHKERSYFTLHLYLNDAIDKDGKRQLEGGATTFFDYSMRTRMDVVPKAGRVLLFQHRELLHSGDDVIKGIKYTMRSDLMYELEEEPTTT